MKLKKLIIIIFFSFMASTYADEKLHYKLQLGVDELSTKIKTKNSTSTRDATTSFNSSGINTQFSYFIGPKSAATASYYKSVAGKYSVSELTIGYRYYFLLGTTLILKSDNKTLTMTPTWSPFITVSYQLLTLSADNGTINFNGPAVEAGTDYQLSNSYYLSAKASYAGLASGATRSTTVMGLEFAIGKCF